MSVSVDGEKSHANHCFTLSQHLNAAKMKLRNSTFGGRVVTTMNQVEVAALEKDAMEVLSLIRTVKNSFAPINRVPGMVFSLVPNYLECQHMHMDKDLIALTHVCRSWRELYISHPSLWSRLDFTNVDKTDTYIKRSKLSPLEATVFKLKGESSLEEALLLAIPHVKRFKSLTIIGTMDLPQELTKHLHLPKPSLEELVVDFSCKPAPTLDTILLNGDLSSLRTLKLGGVVTHLPWKNLSNLTTFKLRCSHGNTITVTKLLNFLESAPLLRDVTLRDSIPTSSNASPSRVVSLPTITRLAIHGDPRHSILLNHLSIPDGASLVLTFNLRSYMSSFPLCLPKTIENLQNLFHITTVDLRFDGTTEVVHLAGPSGRLYMSGQPKRRSLCGPNYEILQSLKYFPLHMTRSLTVVKYSDIIHLRSEEYPYHVYLLMRDLRTLTLIQCYNLRSILLLNPDCNTQKTIIYPKLEELILYVETQEEFRIRHLMEMAEVRASRGAKLRSLKIVSLGELLPGKEVFQLKKYVEHVEYRIEENPPQRDSILDDERD